MSAKSSHSDSLFFTISKRLKNRKNILGFERDLQQRDTLVDRLELIALYLQGKNQFAAQYQILQIINRPTMSWEKKIFKILPKERDQFKNDFNYLLLYILGNLTSDAYRKVLWGYLQNFHLPNLKLNEVRDFKIFEYDELQKLLVYTKLGKPLLNAWAPIFIQLEKQEELISLLKQRLKDGKNIDKMIDLYTCFFYHFSSQNKKIINNRVKQLSDLKGQKQLINFLKAYK